MKPSLRRKLETIAERHEEIALLLARPEVATDAGRFARLSREYAQREPLVASWNVWQSTSAELNDAREMVNDPELGAMATDDVDRLQTRLEELNQELKRLLLPSDPRDQADLFLEVRAGTGGDEASLFAGDLLRMYLRYAERRGWRTEIESAHPGERGGFKEAVARIEGSHAYSRLKFESGTHRVQRVPETESQGRIHTSAATVAIIPESPDIEEVHVDPGDLRVDTFRASGAGGQHVNKTDSAIRITHLPSGLVVECQTERSQHSNRDKAMKRLKAQLLETEREKQTAAEADSRRLQVGSGDRSQRIRTYNFPQGRVTDHRINLTLYRLEEVLSGDLDEIVDALAREQQAAALQAVEE